jgi:hypothetical protein
MAPIPGGVRFTGFVAPSDDSDTYPVIDPFYGIDGWRSVADTTARDAIPTGRRREGMVVVTQDTGVAYQLKGGITNSDWTEGANTTSGYSTQTGVIAGFTLGVHPTNDQAVTVAAGEGQILDSYTDTESPVITPVSYPGNPELVITNIATDPLTNLAVNSSGTVIQQSTGFTDEQKRDLIVIGQVGHADNTIVRSVGTLDRQPVWQTGQSVSDLLSNLGIVNKEGNEYSGVSSTLTIQRSEGKLLAQGVGTDKNCNTLPTITENPILGFTYFYLDAGLNSVFIPKIFPTNFLDPDNYNDEGVLTPVPTGMWSVQRMAMAAGGANITSITYGRAVYDSSRTALNSIDGEIFIPAPEAENIVRLYYLVIKQGATDSTDTDEVMFTPVDNPMIPSYIDNVNRGITKFPTITETGGLNVSWINGSIYDEVTQEIVLTVAGGPVACTNNAVSYLYWSSGTSLTLSTTPPVEPEVSISRFSAQDGVIYFKSDEDLLRTQEANLLSGISNVFPSVVTEGMEVYEDTDVTNAFDVIRDAGTFYNDLHKRVDVIQIVSRTDNMIRHFHTSAAWDSDTNAQIDNNNYDDGTDVTALSANRYAKGMFLSCGAALHWIYPREQFPVEIDAINSALPETPPGLVGLPLLTAYVQKQGDTAFAPESSGRWIDIRTTGGTGGVASAPTEPAQDNAVWWSSVGQTTNDGRSLATAKSSIAEAIVVANSLLPTSTNPITATCEDGYIYDLFSLDSKPWINIYAPTTNIESSTDESNIIGDNNSVFLNNITLVSATNVAIISKTGTGTSTLKANKIYADTGFAIPLSVSGGTLNSTVEILSCVNRNESSIAVVSGHINHIGKYSRGGIRIDFSQSANVSIIGDLEGDIICAGDCTLTVSIGGAWDGLVSTASGDNVHITCSNRTTSVGDSIDPGSLVEINGLVRKNAIWFSSVGYVDNDGFSPDAAKAGIDQGINAASDLTPSSSNIITVNCEDSGIYTSFDLGGSPWINLNAPNIVIEDDLSEIGLNNVVNVGVIRSRLGGSTDIVRKTGSGASYLYAQLMEDNKGGGHTILKIEDGTLYSHVDRIEAFNSNAPAINITSGHLNHSGIDIIGTLDIAASESASITLVNDYSGDITLESNSRANIKIGGELAGTVTVKDGATLWLTAGSGIMILTVNSGGTLYADIRDQSTILGINNSGSIFWLDGRKKRVINPPRDGAVTSTTLNFNDAGAVCTNANCDTSGDNCRFNLPAITARSVGISFIFTNISGEKLTVTCNGANVIRISGNNPGAASTYSELKNASLCITSVETDQASGVWTVTNFTNRWYEINDNASQNQVSTGAYDMAYSDVGIYIENNYSSSLTIRFTDAFNDATSIGASGWIHRSLNTDAATIQLTTSGSQTLKSREPNNYIANPGATNYNSGSVFWQKISNDVYMLTGDISATAN